MFSGSSKGRSTFIFKSLGTKNTRSYVRRPLKNSSFIPRPLKIMTLPSIETMRSINPATQLHIPEHPNAQHHYCRQIKSRKCIFILQSTPRETNINIHFLAYYVHSISIFHVFRLQQTVMLG